MQNFFYKDNQLFCENVSLEYIANQYGTPAYVYSRQAIETNFLNYTKALKETDALVCYAMKANSNLAVLNVLARLGAGFDIVSVGELERVLIAGGNPSKVVFSGVGKQPHEIRRCLELDILCFNVESEAELMRINAIALDMGKRARVSFRVNPDVDAGTHPYISTGLKENKFGIPIEVAAAVYEQAATMSGIEIVGMDCHIGSQLTEMAPFIDALTRLLQLIDDLSIAGIVIQHLDIGGGLGVRYADENPPEISDFISAVKKKLEGRSLKLLLEPGRSIVANAGVLLTRIEYVKHNDQKNFAIVDAAMNDLIRPSLYGAYQDIIPVTKKPDQLLQTWDIVGPVCETSDFLGKDRSLRIAPDDLLAVCSAGAYGFVMASNYNSRPRAVELMVDNNDVHVIRQREQLHELFQHESLLP